MNGEHSFTITHSFHPLCGHTFPLLCQRFAWGEERVFFLDQEIQQVRSLPLAWTNLALPDPFVVVAHGNGQVEAQVNCLKLQKRLMFGRAQFDLLRQRVLSHA